MAAIASQKRRPLQEHDARDKEVGHTDHLARGLEMPAHFRRLSRRLLVQRQDRDGLEQRLSRSPLGGLSGAEITRNKR
jgi:hypothetical protein